MPTQRELEIQNRLIELEKEKQSLQAELQNIVYTSRLSHKETSSTNLSTAEKINLFKNLFKGRQDIYARRWENPQKQTAGYSPAKRYGKLLPLTDESIKNHLQGIDLSEPLIYGQKRDFIIGVYPMCIDETCYFLAIDFDEADWEKEVKAFTQTAKEFVVPCYVERSRSGKGAHIWIFFETSIAAYTARKLGTFLLGKTMEKYPNLSFKSYDRLFPSQDTMPKGGFGNLIALPLQKKSREVGNSVFLDSEFKPYTDQWALLLSIQKIGAIEIETILKNHNALDIRTYFDKDEPWKIDKKEDFKDVEKPNEIKVTLADQLYIEKENLDSKIIAQILKIATFQNSEFYKAQAMRFSTYNIPRIISCAQLLQNHIVLPRGCINDLKHFLEKLEISLILEDKRAEGKKIKTGFLGNLKKEQKEAVNKIIKSEIGILSAPTGFGKTVIAAKVIGTRKVNTLILVHRKQLANQWDERLKTFLNTKKLKIGLIGSGKFKPTGQIDIALMQTLQKKEDLSEFLSEYGQLIIDECHHLAAFGFEQIAKKFRGKYVLGMSATVERKDGHHPIINMQCGEVIHKVDPKKQTQELAFDHIVKPIYTNITIETEENKEPTINQIYSSIIVDQSRNKQIRDDIMKAFRDKRACLLLTERKEHIAYFENYFKEMSDNIIVMMGGKSNKIQNENILKLKNIAKGEELLILATGKYIGEGFDEARLDTLFLTMPISWKGILAQYAGRLNREYSDKKEVIIYDYVDQNIPMLLKMYKRRLKGYQLLGYRIEGEDKK